MPIIQLPNGRYADVPDNIAPEALARIKAENAPTSRQRTAAPAERLTDEQKEVRRRTRAGRRFDTEGLNSIGVLRTLNDATVASQKGLLSRFNDEIAGGLSAATRGVGKALWNLDVSEIGKEYRIARDVRRNLDREAEQRSPGASLVGEIVGAMAMPLGSQIGLTRGAAGAATRLGARGLGTRLGAAATRLESAHPIAQAIAAGAGQGALNAAGEAETLSDVPGSALLGATVGGATGGLLGGATHAARRGVEMIRDRGQSAASRVAYERIAQHLQNADITPTQAQNLLADANKSGNDMIVADLTRGTNAEGAVLSRKPNLPSSDDMIERSVQRIEDRPARFAQQAKSALGYKDADEYTDAISSARKAKGKTDYAQGGAMDKQFVWNDDLENFVVNAPPDTKRAFKAAADEVTGRRFDEAGDAINNDPTALGWKFNAAGDVEYMRVPSMRSFDYVKRGFDTEIGKALKAGDNATAQRLSSELNVLKRKLGEANPEYKEILAAQLDGFQKERAVNIGREIYGNMNNNTRLRQSLRELRKLPEETQLEARVGIIDQIVNTDKSNPVEVFRKFMRNERQRAVLEFAFGGKGNLGRFSRWIERENKSVIADRMLGGRQSITGTLRMAEDNQSEALGDIISNTMRGQAFGGVMGAASGLVRSFKNLKDGAGKMAQEEIAKILMSKGDSLKDGISAAAAFMARRNEANRRAAITAAKGGQQAFTGYAGE